MDVELAALPIAGTIHKRDAFFGGEQYEFTFTNGYGASVIRHAGSYGGTEGYWEIGLLDSEGSLLYNDERFNPSDAVIGWLTDSEVIDWLRNISTWDHQIGQ